MRFIYKILLTINATLWMVAVYIIKCGKSVLGVPYLVAVGLLLLIPIILSLITIWIAKLIEQEELVKCQEFGLADNEFLPTYLGYFFVSLSVGNDITMAVMYIIVFIFTFLSQTQYFNPIFLLFGYHYYHILTPNGSRVFVITHGPVIRNKEHINFKNLRRINDTTYIERK